jgi:hypothetical protein
MGLGSEGLLPGLLGNNAADVDEIISDHAEADPALHSGIAPVAAAIETVSPLDHADATLASGAPFLAVSGLLGALDSGDTYLLPRRSRTAPNSRTSKRPLGTVIRVPPSSTTAAGTTLRKRHRFLLIINR